jgi:hypothetical protein
VLKVITAATYTNFETEIIDDGGPEAMEQQDSFLAGPTGEMLTLKFRAVDAERLEV